MGGKNHQPCRQYLPNSTALSKHLSLAFAHLEFGNAALEDILLREMSGAPNQKVHEAYDGLAMHVSSSIGELKRAEHFRQQLREQMIDAAFVDLPPLGKIDLHAMGSDLASRGIVDGQAWESIRRLMEKGGFYAVLETFEEGLASLRSKTEALQAKFVGEHFRHALLFGHVTELAEENQCGNFKAEFAALYTEWGAFQAHFLASSILSTELWYAFTGRTPLSTPTAIERAA